MERRTGRGTPSSSDNSSSAGAATMGPPSPSSSSDAATACSLARAEDGAAAQQWVRGALLGSGAYGRVYTAVDLQSGGVFAVKTVDAAPQTPQARLNLRALENEIQVLSSLDSPYIVKYLGHSCTEEERGGRTCTARNLHLEVAPGGSLAALIKALGGKGGLGETLIRRYTTDVLRGLEYLHARNVVHGDLKCLNVLVGASSAKLADFGTAWVAEGANAPQESSMGSLPKRLRRSTTVDMPAPDSAPFWPSSDSAQQLGSNDTVKGLRGSPCWMSPETVRELSCQGTAADVWSLGCTVLEMATGKAPWVEAHGGVFGVLFNLGCTDSLPHIPEALSPRLKSFIRACLKRSPEERPTASELLRHPFITGAADACEEAAPSLPSKASEGPPLAIPPCEDTSAEECSGRVPRRAVSCSAIQLNGSFPGTFTRSITQQETLTSSCLPGQMTPPPVSPSSSFRTASESANLRVTALRRSHFSGLSAALSSASREDLAPWRLANEELSPKGDAAPLQPCTPSCQESGLGRETTRDAAPGAEQHAGVSLEDSCPSFPLLDLNFLKGLELPLEGSPKWPLTSAGNDAKDWIVVRSPTKHLS